jgi:hypothetical protein
MDELEVVDAIDEKSDAKAEEKAGDPALEGA